MKNIVPILLLLIFTSCASIEKVTYLQDREYNVEKPLENITGIKIQPRDRISIIVTCKDPEFANMFNLYRVQNIVGAESAVNDLNAQRGDILGYTVDEKGNVCFPILGNIKVSGLTKKEIEDLIKNKLTSSHYVDNATVTINFLNMRYSILGEVKTPGKYTIINEQLTIFEALARAGDLTIYGSRNNISVIRTKNNKRITYKIDLRTKDIFNSPAYFIQQNDIIYVEPNKMRANQSVINGNNLQSTSFWISALSLLSTIAILLTNL